MLQDIKNGSHLEDAMVEDAAVKLRAKNHFHDPTRMFIEAGLDNGRIEGQSAAVWGYFADDNEWDLKSFYDCFERSFMASTTEVRVENLQKTFRTAGHLMHLLQDMSVPAHVRNGLFEGEGHTTDVRWAWPPFGSSMEAYLLDNAQFIGTVPPNMIPSFDHFTNYFDTKYYRSHSEQSVAGLSVGLAEYTNSNFFNELQYFYKYEHVSPRSYPNPDLRSGFFWDEKWDAADRYPHLELLLPVSFYSAYIGRADSDPEINIRHLARVGFFSKYGIAPEGTGAIFLDDACRIDYLEKLVPKAVAYSAGLLEFLFRGDIDFEIDVSDTVPIAVTNNSAKDMDGLFTLYYETAKGGRKKVADGEWQLTVPAGETVQVSGSPLDLPRDLGAEQTFTLVFRGTLGSVFNAVTGKTTSFSVYDFACLQDVEYWEIQPPVPYEFYVQLGGQGPDPSNIWKRHFDCQIDFENNLSDHTAWRRTDFTFQVRSTPAIAKKIGTAYVEGQWFTINGNNSYMPGVVEYMKIAKAPGEWEYTYDASGTSSIVPGGAFGNPVSYVDGLWRSDSGYPELFWNQIAADNNTDECILEERASSPDIIVRLYSTKVGNTPLEPNCPNADEIMDRVRSLCANEYANFYNDTLAMAAPHLPTIHDDEWQNYGIEIRYNRLNLLYPLKGDGTIYSGPVTLTKPYGSTDLIVH